MRQYFSASFLNPFSPVAEASPESIAVNSKVADNNDSNHAQLSPVDGDDADSPAPQVESTQARLSSLLKELKVTSMKIKAAEAKLKAAKAKARRAGVAKQGLEPAADAGQGLTPQVWAQADDIAVDMTADISPPLPQKKVCAHKYIVARFTILLHYRGLCPLAHRMIQRENTLQPWAAAHQCCAFS